MDNVHVAIRVRPLIKRENDASSQILWQCDKNSICQTGSKSAKPYTFDRVFGPDESTDVVYKDIAQPIIQASMNGYDGTIFAYGQTSSGKTHTMQGDAKELGIIPKAINELFEIIENTPQREFLFRVSYMEIYNEIIKDLLQEQKSPLTIRENEQRRVYVSNLYEAFVTDPDEVLELMRIGNERRHIGQTNMNEHSSRSHTIFKVIIESRERKGEDETTDLAVNCSELNLVDLAGSERANDTKADGVRLKEAGNINRSLFALCNVISRLSAHSDFIPFRDSKLTRILQSALGGNAKTAVVCTVTPVSLDQTESTLQFASRAKTITNKPKINEILTGEAQIQRFQKEIQSLKQQVEFYKQHHEVQPQVLQGQQDQERIAKLEEETLSQQQKINQLERMILVSKTDQAKSPDNSKVAKRKRRETWCPGALKRKAMYTSMTDDLVPQRNIFRQADSFFADVMSLPSNSPSSMSTFNDSHQDTSFNDDDDACSKLQSSPVLKQSKNVRWADHSHVSTQTDDQEESDDKEERLQEVIGICEGVVNEKEKMEEQMKLANMELLNLNQVISKLEYDKSQMHSKNESLRKEIEEAKAVKLFEEDEKAMWKLEEAELMAKVSAMEEQVATMKRKVDTTDQSKAEMEILHNMEKEKQGKRVKELESQLQLSYEELNGQREASSEENQREGKVRELEAQRDLLQEELSRLTDSNKELEDTIQMSRTSFVELEEKFAALQSELEAAKLSAEEQHIREEKQRSAEADKATESEAKIETLEKEIEKMKNEAECLAGERIKLEEELKEERIAKEKMEQESVSAKTEVETMELRYQELQKDFKTWKETAESQKLEMEAKVAELLSSTQAQESDSKVEMEKLRKLISNYEEETSKLKTEASRLDEAMGALGRMEEELSTTKSELESMRDIKSKLQQELEQREKELEAVQQGDQMREDSLSEIERLNGLIEQLEKESLNMRQSHERIDEELKASKSQMEEERVAFEKKEEDMLARLTEMRSEIGKDADSDEMDKLSQEVRSYQEEVERLHGLISQLKTETAEMTETKERCQQLEQDLNSAREELVLLKEKQDDGNKDEARQLPKAEIEKYQAELVQVKEEAAMLRKSIEDLQEANSRLAQVEEELSEAQTKEEEARLELEILQEEVAGYKNASDNLTDMETKLATKEQDVERAHAELEKCLTEVTQLKEEVSQLKALNASICDSQEGAKKEIENLFEENSLLKEESGKLKTENDDLTITKANLEENLQDAQEKICSLQEAFEIQQSEYEMKGDEKVKALEDKVTKMESELEERERNLQEAVNEREKTTASLEGSIDELKVDLESKQIELELLKEECAALNSSSDGRPHEEEKNQLERKIEELVAERDQLKADLEESITCSIDAQEELRITQEALEETKQALASLEENFQKELAASKENEKKPSEDEFDFFTDTIACLQREKESLIQEQTEKEDLINLYKEKATKLEEEAAILNDQIQEKMQEAEVTEATVKELQERLDKGEKEYEQLSKEYDEMMKLQEEAEMASSKLMEELEDQKQQLQYATSEIEELQKQAKQQEESSRESELQEKLDQAVDYLEQINKDYEAEKKRHCQTVLEKEDLEQKLKRKEEDLSSQIKVLKDSCESANTRYQEEVERRECLQKDLKEQREMNATLEADLANQKTLSESHQSLAAKEDEQKTEKLCILEQSLTQEKKLHSETKKLNEELEEKLNSYKKEALSKTELLVTACRSANENYRKATKERDQAEKLLKEEQARNEKLLAEMKNERTLSESHQSLAAKEDEQKTSSEGLLILEQSLTQEKKLHSEAKKLNEELEEKLNSYKKEALSKTELLVTACRSANENYRKATKERDQAEKLLKEEQARNEKLLAEMKNERTLSESHQSLAAKEDEKKTSSELRILEQSLTQEKKLHSETKKLNEELETMTNLPDPKTLSREELVTLVNELGVEQKSHRRQLQQYKQILDDSTGPTSVSHESGVIGSVAALHLKSHNYHLEKENVMVEKKLKKVSEILKTERLKYEEMKGKKEYWKGEYAKMVHGKRKIDCPSVSKPLRDNNSPLVHRSPTKRLKEAQPTTTSSGPLKQPSKKQPTLETADWLDAEMEKLQDQENCTTQ